MWLVFWTQLGQTYEPQVVILYAFRRDIIMDGSNPPVFSAARRASHWRLKFAVRCEIL